MSFAAAVLIMLSLCTTALASREPGSGEMPRASGEASGKAYEGHGSAETPAGTTLIVSIFVSDLAYAWNPASDADAETQADICRYLKTAGAYLESAAEAYGREAEFIVDFEENKDLRYTASFNAVMTGEEGASGEYVSNDELIWQYIEEEIDLAALTEKYEADNVLFFAVFNTDEDCAAITCTRNWYEGMPYPYEIVYLFNIDSGVVNCPAVYAHEILHTFGAPDYYMEDAQFGITQKVVSYIEKYLGNDIMYTCSDSETGDYLYDGVTNTVGEMTAYFVGLTDKSQTASYFRLTSEHDEGN